MKWKGKLRVRMSSGRMRVREVGGGKDEGRMV